MQNGGGSDLKTLKNETGLDKISDCRITLNDVSSAIVMLYMNQLNTSEEACRTHRSSHVVKKEGTESLNGNRLVQPRDLFLPWSSSSLEESVTDPILGMCSRGSAATFRSACAAHKGTKYFRAIPRCIVTGKAESISDPYLVKIG